MFAYKIVFNVYKCSRWLSMMENGMVRCMSTHYFEKRPLVTYVPAAKYGGRHTVTMIPGDGLGPELMGHVKQVFRAAAVPVDFEEVLLDSQHDSEEDLDNAVLAVKRNKVALKGNVETHHAEPGFISHNLLLRVRLDLQANIVHCRSVPGVRARHADIDVVVIRENTEGEYKSLEHENVPGVVESLKIITREHSESIAHYAFQYALDHGRKKVTAVHKANIMKLADGMFLNSCRRVAAQYPSVQFQDMIVDNTCMQLVSRPQQFDVMVMPNLYGNIVANIGVGIAGGDGLTAGANIGPQYAIFETGTRSTGKSITGQNTANPTAMLLAGVKLCRYLGLSAHADVIESAIWKTISDDKVHTPDLGGSATTSDVLDSITQKIGAHMASR